MKLVFFFFLNIENLQRFDPLSHAHLLVQNNVQTNMKITVLKNILMFLAEEE
jgi:hypothetical protein